MEPKANAPEAGEAKLSPRMYENDDYEVYWKGGGLARQRLNELEQSLVRDLLPPSGERILEVGCGFGRLFENYEDRFRQSVLLDGSMSLLRQARERTGGRAWYVAGDAMNLPFKPAAFDGVVMVRVFHHIPDSRQCIEGLHRVVARDGHLVFNFTNKRNVLQIGRWALRRTHDDPFSRDMVEWMPTLFGHHPKHVAELLREIGFVETRYRGAGVMDKVVAATGPLGRYVPDGKGIAANTVVTSLAPLIFTGSRRDGGEPLLEARELRDLLQCSACGGSIEGADPTYRCAGCGRSYPVEDGIVDMRIDAEGDGA